MVVRCSACSAAYKIAADRIPATGVRVRCPRCAHVFRVRTPDATPAIDVLAGIERDNRTPPRHRTAPAAASPDRRAVETRAPALPARPTWNEERTLDLEGSRAKGPAPRLETAPFRPGDASIPTTSVAPAPAPVAPAPQDERARRLARVLVSDILVYNQAARDRALGEGNLPVALAAEINKAWDLYKSKVSPDVASGTTFFKDALNEILADGTKVF